MDPVKATNDLLDIMGYLFKNGADPTMKSNQDKTPKDIAIKHGFKLGTALLGNSTEYLIVYTYLYMYAEVLEYTWSKTYAKDKSSPHSNTGVHKQLLDW